MLLYLDKENRIMAINETDRNDLTEVKVNENSEFYPFKGWSNARILCYKIGYHYPQTGVEEQTDENGETIEIPTYSEYAEITMLTPYVPTHMMAAIEMLDKENAELKVSQAVQDETLTQTQEVIDYLLFSE